MPQLLHVPQLQVAPRSAFCDSRVTATAVRKRKYDSAVSGPDPAYETGHADRYDGLHHPGGSFDRDDWMKTSYEESRWRALTFGA
jgi:hypothetical protein